MTDYEKMLGNNRVEEIKARVQGSRISDLTIAVYESLTPDEVKGADDLSRELIDWLNAKSYTKGSIMGALLLVLASGEVTELCLRELLRETRSHRPC